MPKQFVKLFNGQSLFQLTVERNRTLCDEQFIVSNSEQYFLAYDQLEELGRSNNRYLLEPIRTQHCSCYCTGLPICWHLIDICIVKIKCGAVYINFFHQFLYRNFLNTLLLHKTGKPRSQLCLGLTYSSVNFFPAILIPPAIQKSKHVSSRC